MNRSMTQIRMKGLNKIIFSCMGLLSMGCVVIGALTGESEGWLTNEQYGGVGFSSESSGSITVSFAAQGAPSVYTCAAVVADPTSNDGAFSGDYINGGVKGLSFKITSNGYVPGDVMVILRSNGIVGREWRNENISVSGNGVTNVFRFNLEDGWQCNCEGDLAAMWDNDLRSVGVIGIRLTPGSSAAESYTIEQFQLLDENGVSSFGDAELTPAHILNYFGVQSLSELTDEQRNQDSDGDGMTDLMELLAGMNPLDANSIFAAKIGRCGSVMELTWPCVTNGNYAILRTTSMTDLFTSIAIGLTPSDTDINNGFMTYVDYDSVGGRVYFYRIVKE